jgi:hypothetical protein
MDEDLEHEERAIYAIVTAAAAPVVIAFAIQGGTVDGSTTLSFALVLLGVVGLRATVRTARCSVPRARALLSRRKR